MSENTIKINQKITNWEIKEKNIGKEINLEAMPLKRPTLLPCDIHQVKVQGEAWTIFVGLYNGKPYEIFGGLSEYVKIPKKVKSGKIEKYNGNKNTPAKYNLHYGDEDDETIIRDVSTVFQNLTHGAFTRLLSLSLRSGAEVNVIVEQLNKGDMDNDMFNFTKVVSRVLKNYIQDGTKTDSVKACPSCGRSDGFHYEEGCVKCSCGWSKCN